MSTIGITPAARPSRPPHPTHRHRPAPTWCDRFIELLEHRRLFAVDPIAGTLAMSPAAAAKAPDLTAKLTTLPKGSIRIAAKAKPTTVKVLLTNAGTAPAKGRATLSLYASFDQTLDPATDVLLASPKLNLNLAPKAKTTATVTFKTKASVPSGDYFLIANVDSTNKIAESNETNNAAVSKKTVKVVNPAIPPGPHFTAAGLDSTANTLIVSQPEQIAFTATISGQTPSTAMEVDEVDSSGNFVSKVTDLFDDGSDLHNDTTAGDGIFNNTVALGFDAPADHFLVAKVAGPTGTTQQTSAIKISAVPAPSPAELQQVMSTSNAMDQQVSTALAAGQTPQQALDAVQASLLAMPPDQVDPNSLERAPHSLAWSSPDGIMSIVNTDEAHYTGQKGAAPIPGGQNDPTPAAPGQTSGATAKKAVVLAPYAWNFEPNDESDEIRSMLSSNGWAVTQKRNEVQSDQNISIDDFKNFGQFGTVVISSHGDTLPRAGGIIYTSVPATLSNDAALFSDLFNHRLMISHDTLAITGRFITQYSGRMDGSIVYLSSCRSAADSSLADAFIHQGAKAVIGYTDYVASDFADRNGILAYRTLLERDHNTVGDIPGIDVTTETDSDPATFKEFGDLNATLPNPTLALANYDLYLQYSWPLTSRDLDTNTEFLNSTAGFSGDNNSPYIHWGGDNTSGGGTEFATVDLNQAFQDGKISVGTPATVLAHAGWFAPSNGTGPATLTVGLIQKDTEGSVNPLVKDVVTKTIAPGSQSGLATTQVGVIIVSFPGDPFEPDIAFTLA